MRWFGTLLGQGPDVAPPVSGASWRSVTAGRLRLWHSTPAPAHGVRQVEADGCTMLVLGCCTSSGPQLLSVARRVGRGHTEALAEVDGSRVVIAARADSVVLLGDLAGQRLVFYTQTPAGGLVIGSDSRTVAAAAGAPILAREWVATHLLMTTAPNVWWTGTPWVGVRTLRPGWLLHTRPNRLPLARPGPSLPKPECGFLEASVSLREALGRAVHTRMVAASRPTTDLSGGMDSSTITALAARTSAPLSAFTLNASGSDDIQTAKVVAASCPSIEHITLGLPDSVASAYSDLDEFPVGDEPAVHLASAHSRAQWWLRQLVDHGSDLHLSGEGGDNVLQASPAYLADLATPKRMPLLWRHAVGWARLRHQSPLTLVMAALRLHRVNYREALIDAARALRGSQSQSPGWYGLVSWFGRPRAEAWATSDARRLVAAVVDRAADENPTPLVPSQGFGVGDTAALLTLHWAARAERQYTWAAQQCGVNYHSPYLDDGVVRACWSLPAWQRTDPRILKPLLRGAFSGDIPSPALHRHTKGNVTTLIYQGIQLNAPVLQDLFTQSRLAELGLVHEDEVRKEIRRGADLLPVRIAALDAVVSAELWLRGVTR
ncbi:albusnodin/ikarugamycin family macrolactam cyclase [Actinoalloteichus caeruleus]|uniref:albusnodin/ikarugamycin family macrolactam cyclase n=1 Tax=Actinoalloteichus cyanogriseus TaxID=2893586 RepID=UPI003AABB265